ncbi:hypothetical protein BP6252_00123 [Coleophoma cylindrospora]|uniref:Uncharacterized protein n=1 Tax=Coleophoma cylindrospora TaxID=1849047 RepID=A0A3D8SPJ1_9HELO|nr:hypothetical protein BP6252_00123 [Coleophoma cylindrospora]
MASGKTLAEARRGARANAMSPSSRVVEGHNCIVIRERIEHAIPKTPYGNDMIMGQRIHPEPIYLKGKEKANDAAESGATNDDDGDSEEVPIDVDDDDDDDYVDHTPQNKRKRGAPATSLSQGPKNKRAKSVEVDEEYDEDAELDDEQDGKSKYSKNARGYKGRSLVNWHSDLTADRFLLCLQYEAAKLNTPLPWQAAIDRFAGPGSSDRATAQWLTKLRSMVLKKGFLVPPRVCGSSFETDDNGRIRGYVLAEDINGNRQCRAVMFEEVFKDRKKALEVAGTIGKGSGSYLHDPVAGEIARMKGKAAIKARKAIEDANLGYFKISTEFTDLKRKEVYYLAKQKEGDFKYRVFKVLSKSAHLMLLPGSEDSLVFHEE